MASKEATVYIVDLSSSMGDNHHGRQLTDLEWAMQYVWDRITTTVATDRKTAHIGVVALASDHTQNELDSEDAYRNISVLHPLGQVQMTALRSLRNQIHPSNTPGADALSAIVIAIQLISDHCRHLKYLRRIVLVTNARSQMDASDLDNIASKIRDDGIELLVVGVDFDDADYPFHEPDKDATKATNEASLANLSHACRGGFGTLAQAVDELAIPRLKTVRPVHSYKGYLSLGNIHQFDSAMAIDVERYPKTMVARPPTASNFVIRSDMAPGESTQQASSPHDDTNSGDGLAAVKNARVYQVPDANAPGGKRDVQQDQLAKGYAYGSTAVYISESDRNVTTFETSPGLEIIGFVAKEDYQHYMDMSRTNMIVAQRTNDKANIALSSFIHALYELDTYAVARLVVKDNKPPLLLLLTPSIEPDLECLYDVELPFREDVRLYRFPPLDRILTVSGKTITQHRNLPSSDLVAAMSDFVDAMDLSTAAVDDAGQPAEYAPVDETFSPVLHRVNQVIRHRAVYPNSQIPPIPPALTKFAHPPSHLVETAKPFLDRIKTSANIKKVPPKVRARRGRKGGAGGGGADSQKPLSGLDVDALLASGSTSTKEGGGTALRTKCIDKNNAIPEYKQALRRAVSVDMVHDATKQLGDIIRDYIRHSLGSSGYGRAIEAIRVMRHEAIDLEEAAMYNVFIKDLKRQLLRDELGGDRSEMWYQMRLNKLELISSNESPGGEPDDQIISQFMASRDM